MYIIYDSMNKHSVFLTIHVHCIRCGSPEEADDSAGGTAKNPAEVQRRPERVAASTHTSFTLDLFLFLVLSSDSMGVGFAIVY